MPAQAKQPRLPPHLIDLGIQARDLDSAYSLLVLILFRIRCNCTDTSLSMLSWGDDDSAEHPRWLVSSPVQVPSGTVRSTGTLRLMVMSRVRVRGRAKAPELSRNEREVGVDGIPPSRQWRMRRSLRPVISDARLSDKRSSRGKQSITYGRTEIVICEIRCEARPVLVVRHRRKGRVVWSMPSCHDGTTVGATSRWTRGSRGDQ